MNENRKPERKKATLGHFDHAAFMLNLGKRIHQLRIEKEFTSYEHFAHDIDISRSGMAKYEACDFNDIQMSTLLKIIDGLEMTPVEFFSEGFDE